MHRRISVVAMFTAIALAACSTDTVVTPLRVPTGPKFAVSAPESGDYVVMMNGNGISKDFTARVAMLGGKVTWSHAGAGIATVSGLTNAGAVDLASTSGVGDVEPDIEVGLDTPLAAAEADASGLSEPSINSVANPALAGRYNWQWNMRAIGANDAWTAGKLGSADVTVAILDTGLDYDIPDLNGLVDLSRSTSFVPADNALRATYFPTRNNVTDFHGHGTNVATQVSSKAAALAGVTSKTTLIGVKVLGRTGSGTTSGVLAGVLWAADHGANVANMSLGNSFSKAGAQGFHSLINRTFNYAKQKGMLIVVSAGNDGIDLQHNGNVFVSYCDAPHVICVSAVGLPTWTGNADAIAYYTNFGRNSASVAAPGGNQALNAAGTAALVTPGWPWAISPTNPLGNDIASWVWSYCPKDRIAGLTAAGVPVLTVCAAGNRLTGYIGTSQASPHVAGLAASLMAEYGTGQPEQIKHLIEKSAAPIDPAYGRGRISVKNAFGL